MNNKCAVAWSCSFPTVLKSCREMLQKGSRKRHPKTDYLFQLLNITKLYAKRGLTIELHFSVAGYGGLHLQFSGIIQCLRGLVSVYERLIVAGDRILIVSSISVKVSFTPFWRTLSGSSNDQCGQMVTLQQQFC